jgi:L-amino acid N-acyltransferase YncA
MEITIRAASGQDGAAVAGIYAHYITHTAITFEEQIVDAAAMTGRIEETIAKYPYLVAEADGKVAGYAYACPHRARASYRWAVDVTVYLDEAYHRRGIGRGLYGVLLPVLKRQGFVTAYAGIALPNAASVGVHEAMGFEWAAVYRNVGFKLGAWRDVGWWGKTLNDPASHPTEPIAWPALGGLKPVRFSA